VWRRLLREDTLWNAADPATRAPLLSREEREIVSAFAAHREAAYWPVQGYRYRQVQQLMSDLGVSAPLTTTVLRAHGRDLKPHVQRHFERTGWRDFGWRSEQGCDAFLSHLATQLSSEITGLSELIALEQAQLRLLIRLSDRTPERWPRPASPTVSEHAQYQRSPAATTMTSARDLSPWLEAPEEAHLVVPNAARQHLIVYLPSPDEPPRIAALSEDANVLFDALADALTLRDAVALLPDASGARAHATLVALAETGVLCEAASSA
jgi:hypothetical protein